jgi:hypothetical protein
MYCAWPRWLRLEQEGNPMRFNYSTHKTFEAAAMALEEYYSTGEVCDGEHPEIEGRDVYTPHKRRVYSVVIDGD